MRPGSRAEHCHFTRNQKANGIRRLTSSHQLGKQGLGLLNRHNEQIMCSSAEAGRQIRKFRISPRGKGSQCCSRRIIKIGVQSGLGSTHRIFVQRVQQSSVTTEQAEECNALDQAEADPNNWREPIIKYIKNKEEPNDKAMAERIARKSAHYTIVTPGFGRQTECKPCTCQDQKLTYTAIT
jgi:hypothetical protein